MKINYLETFFILLEKFFLEKFLTHDTYIYIVIYFIKKILISLIYNKFILFDYSFLKYVYIIIFLRCICFANTLTSSYRIRADNIYIESFDSNVKSQRH